MQRRVIKDAFPPMIKFLDKQAQVSIKSGPLHSHSQIFKLQLTVLRNLGSLCKQLEVSDTNLSPLVLVCGQYLSFRQPKELQQVSEAHFISRILTFLTTLYSKLIKTMFQRLFYRPHLSPHHHQAIPVASTKSTEWTGNKGDGALSLLTREFIALPNRECEHCERREILLPPVEEAFKQTMLCFVNTSYPSFLFLVPSSKRGISKKFENVIYRSRSVCIGKKNCFRGL